MTQTVCMGCVCRWGGGASAPGDSQVGTGGDYRGGAKVCV